uniref:FGGY_N domain-containing protein n=1 Tax=Globodera pallida TaxID=36090 RepID=A0A183C1P9_GLOPA
MFLGIDLGTSGVKTLLIDAEQQVIASASAPLNVSHPSDGWGIGLSGQCTELYLLMPRACRFAVHFGRHA